MRRRVSSLSRQALDAVLACLVAAGLLAVTVSACTTSDQPDQPDRPVADGAPPAGDESTPVPVDVRVRVTRVSGALPAARREAVAAQVRRVLDGYVRSAYLDQDGTAAATRSARAAGPAGAFAAFTPDAARQAQGDRDVLTSSGFGAASSVRPVQATALLSVLSPKGHVVGATAQTTLRFAVTDDDGATRRRLVRGRLLLTPTAQGWRIFGYELTAPAGAER